MNFSERFYEVLREKSQERGWQSAFAQKAGISQSSLSKIISGETKAPELATVSAIIDALGDELAITPTIRGTAPNAPIDVVDGPGLCTINVYAVAGAGQGFLPDQLEPIFRVTAPPEYFKRADYAVVVDGHSMEPLIPHGAVVGIKLSSSFMANELYLANIPYEGLVIKRVGVDRQASEFIFKSQNPDKDSYPDFRLSISESEKIIIGRVVWILIGY